MTVQVRCHRGLRLLEGRLSLLAVEAIGMGRFNNFLAELWPTGPRDEGAR